MSIVSDPRRRLSGRFHGVLRTMWLPAALVALGASLVVASSARGGESIQHAAPAMMAPEDFRAELVRASAPSEGLWLSLTLDTSGRWIITPREDGLPLLRLAPSTNRAPHIEPFALPMVQTRGLCFAFGSLFAYGRGAGGTGLYRLTDVDESDAYDSDEVRLLQRFEGQGDDRRVGITAGPDGSIFLVIGPTIKPAEGVSPDSPYRYGGDGSLLPQAGDRAKETGDPEGQGSSCRVLRIDPESNRCELWLGGLRGPCALAVGPEGEFFTLDIEADSARGLPWHRPMRLIHAISGGDYGWREGPGSRPGWYPDTLPGNLDLGLGTANGLKAAASSRFPPRYRRALFAADAAYGRILAIHLQPQGATFAARHESFLSCGPLNPTDLEFGADGALYFLANNGGVNSALYRVSHLERDRASRPEAGDSAEVAPETDESAGAAAARGLRHRLEAWHARRDASAVDAIWPHLRNCDRWVQYAARIALENQDPSRWQERALAESQPRPALAALLALARVATPDFKPAILIALQRLGSQSLTDEQSLDALRVLELVFIRMGRPEDALREAVTRFLSPYYPSPSESLNRELCQLLVYLEAPGVVEKTLALQDSAPTIEEQIHYLFSLGTLKSGWNLEQRKHYFHSINRVSAGGAHPPALLKWFHEAGRPYADGASLGESLGRIRQEAQATLAEPDLAGLRAIINGQALLSVPAVTNRTFVREWSVQDVLPLLEQVDKPRSMASGREAVRAAQCLTCHRFRNEGGSVGPDLTAVGSRLGRRELIESILSPSKVVAPQYRTATLTMEDGEELTGRIVEETSEKFTIVANALTGQTTEIERRNIRSKTMAALSPMPEGLTSILTKEEVLDLVTYLESGGQERRSAP